MDPEIRNNGGTGSAKRALPWIRSLSEPLHILTLLCSNNPTRYVYFQNVKITIESHFGGPDKILILKNFVASVYSQTLRRLCLLLKSF